MHTNRLTECRNGDCSLVFVALWAADGGVGGWAWKTVSKEKYIILSYYEKEMLSGFFLNRRILFSVSPKWNSYLFRSGISYY